MTEQNEIKSNVLEKIRGGGVSMRPRAYFIARVLLVSALAALALALSAVIVSFTLFSLDASGARFLLGFGGRGIAVFLSLFPWGSFVAAVILFMLLEWLLRYFKFGYRIPLLLIFAGILAVSVGSAVLIDWSGAHSMLLQKADQNELPVIGELYESIRTPHDDRGVFHGTVLSLQDGEISVLLDSPEGGQSGATRTVIAPNDFATSTLRRGDRIYIAGDSTEEAIHAYGIRKLSPPPGKVRKK